MADLQNTPDQALTEPGNGDPGSGENSDAELSNVEVDKAAISRANGAKSKGPITPEGKAVSARNALRHGLAAKNLVLEHESEPAFRALLATCLDHFHPRNPFELELVTTMAISRWRLRRIPALETHMLAYEVHNAKEKLSRLRIQMDEDERLAFAFKENADRSNGIALLTRYESVLHRAHDRALKQLQSLRAERPVSAQPALAEKTHTTERTQLLDPLP